MIELKDAFSSFAVTDVAAAREFYRDTIGLQVADDMGGLRLTLPSGQTVFVYQKDDHEPAVFTVLNLLVDDLDAAVDALNAAGVVTKIYDAPNDYGTDERGVAHSDGEGPDISWFRDPSGNVIAVIGA